MCWGKSDRLLESLNLKLRARMDQEAINKDGSLDSMLSGIILALRGQPAYADDEKSKTISPSLLRLMGII